MDMPAHIKDDIPQNFVIRLDNQKCIRVSACIEKEDLFLRFWEDRDITRSLSLHKPAVGSPDELSPTEINTITGATISSEAVLGIVNLSMDKLRQMKKEGQLESKGNDVD